MRTAYIQAFIITYTRAFMGYYIVLCRDEPQCLNVRFTVLLLLLLLLLLLVLLNVCKGK